MWEEVLKERKITMGCVGSIDFYKFPKQGKSVGKRVEVCFHFDTSKTIKGTIVRDDREDPGETIIKLDDGRVVRADECQYSIVREHSKI